MKIWSRSTSRPNSEPRSTSIERGRSRVPLPAALLGALTIAALAGAVSAQASDRQGLVEERNRLMRENAVMQARVSLSKDNAVYLVADLGSMNLRLELQGVTLASLPIDEVRLNKHAERLLTGDDSVRMLATPFALSGDRWFELNRAVATVDSSSTDSKPDTTGARMELIRTQPVTAMLTYDRRLTMVLEGQPPRTRWQKLKDKAKTWLQSWSSGTLAATLRRQSADEVMITLEMAPADVRSLAPTLVDGAKLILVPREDTADSDHTL